MRIVFIGNANNEPFRIAHEWAKMGVHCSLLPTSAVALDDPRELLSLPYYAGTSVEIDSRFVGAQTWDWIDPGRGLLSELRHRVRDADLLFLNGLAISTAVEMGNSHIAMLTGSDLVVYAAPEFPVTFEMGRRAQFRRLMGSGEPRRMVWDFWRRQRTGISTAHVLLTGPVGDDELTDATLTSCGASHLPRFTRPSYTPFRSERRAESPFHEGLPHRSRETHGTVVFVAGRHVLPSKRHRYSDVTTMDQKGSLAIIEGIALAYEAGFSGRVVITEKGQSTRHVRSATKTRGLEERIGWVPEMSLSAFLKQIYQSDVVIDTLGPAIPSRITVEGIAAGATVISNAPEERQLAKFGGLIPNISPAASPEDLAAALLGAPTRHSLSPDIHDANLGLIDPELNARRLWDLLSDSMNR